MHDPQQNLLTPSSAAAKVLIVIPSFNDAERLSGFLETLAGEIQTSGFAATIQVVDDGSREEEARASTRVVSEAVGRYGEIVRPIQALPRNVGKGGAIYAGWATAREESWLAFADADGATPAAEVIRICRLAVEASGLDAILASRVKLLGRAIIRKASRHLIGRVHATLASTLAGIPVYDSQCGCKVFRRAAIESIRSHLVTMRFGFDMEIIAHLIASGYTIREEPLEYWEDIAGSKVNLITDSLDMARSLLVLRGRLQARRAREAGRR